MPKLNPGELEVDLFCQGLRIAEDVKLAAVGRPLVQMRAGLGSGLEIIIPGSFKDIWMNVPVREHFVRHSPYCLQQQQHGYVIVHESEGWHYPVSLPPAPAWYQQHTARGIPMSRIGVLQGTYLGIYLGPRCAFWENDTRCAFCTTGLNIGSYDHADKQIADVVEVAQAAKAQSGVTFVHFNSGYQHGRGLELVAPYVKAIKEQVGALVGVQVIPSADLWKYDWLIDLGVDHFSFCYEFHNPAYFQRYLPGKATMIGQERFFKALAYTAHRLGKGAVSGEIIAGLEPLEDTLAAIDSITSQGAFPTVCIFRPVPGAHLENHPAPNSADMLTVMQHVYHACRRQRIPIGAAPNIEVSLIVTPVDARYLVRRDLSWYCYGLQLWLWRQLARPYFYYKRRQRMITADAYRPDDYAPPALLSSGPVQKERV